jgi:hypothetical protein
MLKWDARTGSWKWVEAVSKPKIIKDASITINDKPVILGGNGVGLTPEELRMTVDFATSVTPSAGTFSNTSDAMPFMDIPLPHLTSVPQVVEIPLPSPVTYSPVTYENVTASNTPPPISAIAMLKNKIHNLVHSILPVHVPKEPFIINLFDAVDDTVYEVEDMTAPPPLEKTIQKKIKTWLEDDAGCVVLKLNMMRGYMSSGWPDLLVLPAGGNACFIEVKRPGNSVAKIQELRIKELRKQGYDVLVADSLEAVLEWWNA